MNKFLNDPRFKGIKRFENKVWLSSPTMHGDEQHWVDEAILTNWVSTVGKNINWLKTFMNSAQIEGYHSNVAFKNKMFKAISRTFVGNRALFLSHLKFASAEAMLMNRAKSIIMMSSEVFLKQLRRKNYDSIYEDHAWQNRCITSTIYELSPKKEKKQGKRQTRRKWENNNFPEELKPSDAIQRNSKLAASMGTTLWFTPENKAAGMPQAILAAGQYNICYNLLDYINKIKNDPTNITLAHQLIIDCEPQLLQAWQRFQQDPQWMVPKQN